MKTRGFVKKHFRHFNAGALRRACDDLLAHIEDGGQVFLALAGALSTAEIGLSLAEMIRANKVHAISCTGANLEESVFNLIARHDYMELPRYRDTTPHDDAMLEKACYNRVADTCIPEARAMRHFEGVFMEELDRCEAGSDSFFPHELIYKILRSGSLAQAYQIDPADSWILAAAERELPLFVPGWEDSTLGNFVAARKIDGTLSDTTVFKSGIEYMVALTEWYRSCSQENRAGFLQVGGGIAGDFPICVVPLLRKDLGLETIPKWAFYCQISDSITSYGSYSGAEPREKISWGKIDVDTPNHVIESDATIVLPILFAYILDW